MFQWRVLMEDYSGRLGLALAHPLYIAAGRALAMISQRHLPLLLNCFSGLGMAVALANLAAGAALLTGKRWVGLLTAAMLAITHTTWWLSTIAEVYTWSVAGLTAEMWLLVLLLRRPRWITLAGIGLVNGLGLCVHNFALLPLPVYLVVAVLLAAKGKLPVWSLAAAAGAWLVGAGLYLGMTIELAVSSGDWIAAIRSALMGNYAGQVTNLAAPSPRWKENAALSAMNFTGLLGPLAVVGWCRLRSKVGGAVAAAIAAVTLVHIAFFIRYPVPDQFTFILPTLVMLSVAAAVGVAALAGLSRKWRVAVVAVCLLSIIWQPVLYAAAPALAKRLAPGAQRKRKLPFRDEISYWLIPWKHNETSAKQFADAALAQAAPDGVILPDSTSGHPLLLVQKLYATQPSVTVQYAGQPLAPGKLTIPLLRETFADRKLYTVSNVPGHAPDCLIQNAQLTKQPEDVLYTVQLPTLVPVRKADR